MDKPWDHCGYVENTGYRRVRVGDRICLVHRLVWEEANGPIPEGMVIDHINQDKLDNSLDNLRCITPKQNQYNAKLYSNNSSGTRGLYWRAERNTWKVEFRYDGKIERYGSYKDKELAELVAKEAYESIKERREMP